TSEQRRCSRHTQCAAVTRRTRSHAIACVGAARFAPGCGRPARAPAPRAEAQSRNVDASVNGRPNASATAAYVTLPSAMLSPLSNAGLSHNALFHPLLASCIAYGSVAFVSASVDVRGTPPGMLATP